MPAALCRSMFPPKNQFSDVLFFTMYGQRISGTKENKQNKI
jgi:hypothetical protein